MEFINQKNKRLVEVPDAFLSKIAKAEKEIYRQITELLTRLTLRNGMIKINAENLRIASQINALLKQVLLGSSYTEAVTEFIQQFDDQTAINIKAVEKAFPGFEPSELVNTVNTIAKRDAIDLLLNRAADNDFIRPLSDIIEQAVVSGSRFNDTLEAIQLFVEGNEEVDGRLYSYSKTYAHDTFAIADRSVSSLLSEEIEAEWFFYSGDIIPGSRQFCIERHNQFFHYKEIEAWGAGKKTEGMAWPKDGTWPGRIPATNAQTIYSYAGGYSCGHSIMPVSLFSVPKDVIQRAIDQGYYSPSEKELELLEMD